MKWILKNFPLSVGLILVITYLSFFTPPKTQLDEISNFDKFVHFCMYFTLSSVIWIEFLRAYRNRKAPMARGLVGAMVFPIVYSGVVELLQAYATTTRSGDWADFIFNTLGALVGTAVCYFWVRRRFFRDTPLQC
ncbi:MAG: VanZ family protein [Bacteroidaceae bacterium]|nr:VanZ family protein [Bacteroidaceae bacterium]